MIPRLAVCIAALGLLVAGVRAVPASGTVASNLRSIETAAVLGGAQVRSDPSPASQHSECPAVQLCFNQYASGYDPKSGDYIIRANISEVSLTFGHISDRRAVLLFTMTQDPDTKKWVPILDVQDPRNGQAGTPSPWCWQSDCYSEFHTKDLNVAALTFFWVATLDSHNHALFTAAGWPSL